MVVLSNLSYQPNHKTQPLFFPGIPVINLSESDLLKHLLVKACEEFGFFKVINHGVPMDLISLLESEALRFFSLPTSEKEKSSSSTYPFGYGNKRIGTNGDVGWVEYLLWTTNQDSVSFSSASIDKQEQFRYIVVSTFFVLGPAFQVMTNGRFRSVRHRVLANTSKSRVSMIYFGGPLLSERIAPLPTLMEGEESLYKEFTWFEYKKSVFNLRLSNNKLVRFQRIAAS